MLDEVNTKKETSQWQDSPVNQNIDTTVVFYDKKIITDGSI
ncbi:hypothetical protein [Paenibacillus sp. OK060]|nr:hypothetical protein [Paenibacillus sp. OK060]